MKLTEISVQNLRSIGLATIRVHGFTTIIGQNNTGKSTILRAIQILLNQDKPSEDEWCATAPNDPIVITGRFNEISETERNIPGIASLVYNNEIQLRLTVTKDGDEITLQYEAFIRDEHIKGWSDTWRTLSDPVRGVAEALGFNGTSWRTKGNQERVRQAIRDQHPDWVQYGDADWTDEGISINEALKQGLPQVEIVPAIRDAKDEGQLTQRKNIFAEILKNSILPEVETTVEYNEIIQRAATLSQRMMGTGGEGLQETSRISGEISSCAGEVIDLRVLFRLEPPDIKEIIGDGARIRLSDGTETPIVYQGHGAQRALIYALVRYIAQKRSHTGETTRPIILLFEEPELFVHPQLLRTLRTSLKNLASVPGWQVVATTHSPVMIDVADEPQSLVIMRRNEETRQNNAVQLNHDPFAGGGVAETERAMLRATLDFHPTVCEAFFADHAVLVEGDSEVAILRYGKHVLQALTGEAHDIDGVTVVSCGGKWTIIPIARLLREFSIPFKVIHDMDRKGLTNDQLEAAAAIHPFKANAKISEVVDADKTFIVEDTLEHILYPAADAPTTDKPYGAWKRMREILDENQLPNHPALGRLFRFAFDVES
jgi:hypothetical protein